MNIGEIKETLRQYQINAVSKVAEALKNGIKSLIIQMPTGSGKTRTASYILGLFLNNKRKVLWLTDREELVCQTSLTLGTFGNDLFRHFLMCSRATEVLVMADHAINYNSCIVSKKKHKNTENCCIAMIQTIVGRLNSFSEHFVPDVIFIDECHLSMAKTWQDVVKFFQNINPNVKIIGLTATPCRSDKKPLGIRHGGLYETIIRGPQLKELINQGHLSNYKIYGPPTEFDASKLKKELGEYSANSLESQLTKKSICGDVLKHYEAYSIGKPAIGFCPTVKTAEKYAETFREAGYKTISIDGNSDKEIRKKAIKDLGEGEIDVIFSVSILIQGTDIPYATTALVLRKTSSFVVYSQYSGRFLRRHPKKEFAIILDFVGNYEEHGLPDDDVFYDLDQITVNRTKNERDKKNGLSTCLKCGTIHESAPICPECGNIYLVKKRQEIKEDKKGELVEITDLAKKQKKIEVGQANTLAELLLIEKERGHKKGWAFIVYKAKMAKMANRRQ